MAIPTPYFIIKSDNTKVSEAVTNLYFDLSLAPTEFWEQVVDGGDIRVYRVDTEAEVAREVVGLVIDSASGEGSLFFNSAGLSTSTDTEYAVHFGDSEKTEPAADAANGKYNIWDANYEGVWHLGEDPGPGGAGDIKNSVQNLYHGTARSGHVSDDLVDGKLGNAILMVNGTTRGIGFGNVLGMDGLDITLSIWAYAHEHTAHGMGVIGKKYNYNAGVPGYQIVNRHSTDNDPHWAVSDDTTQLRHLSAASRDTWNQLILVWDNSTKTLTSYLNGAQVSQTSDEEIGSIQNSDEFSVGFSGAGVFDGRVNEGRIQSVLRSADWILTEYNNQNNNATFWTVGDVVDAGETLEASPGTFSITGQASGTIVDRIINASPGTYAVTGNTGGLLADRILQADPGAYTYAGASSDLIRDLILSAEPGTYQITGVSSALLVDKILLAESGTYTITGHDATLVVTEVGEVVLVAEPGTFTVTGADAGMVVALLLRTYIKLNEVFVQKPIRVKSDGVFIP
jgi:hypothetical protein